jgi:predicted enzyme related to lactoylglutathione lyase
MITAIATVSIYVEDQDRNLRFWTDKAGFRLVRDIPMGPDGRWIELEPPAGGARIVLYPRTYMKGSEHMRPSIMFECENIRETCERMKESGVEFLGGLMSMKWGIFAQFRDPEGHVHFLKEKGSGVQTVDPGGK